MAIGIISLSLSTLKGTMWQDGGGYKIPTAMNYPMSWPIIKQAR